MPIELTVAIVGLGSTLSAVLLTQFLNQRNQNEEFRSKYLSDSLADLFHFYLYFWNDNNDENRSLLLTAIERCRLYCSDRFVVALDDFEEKLLYNAPNHEAVGKSFARLRELSRKEVTRRPQRRISKKKRYNGDQQ